eukprot:1792121-Amphidinium_carterae.1
MPKDKAKSWSMGQKLPGELPRSIVTKLWHSHRAEVPIPVLRRDEPPPELPGLPVPPSLTADEWEQHLVTHCPYNPSCEYCVQGRARGELHKQRQAESPEIEIDWTYWPSVGQTADEPTPGALVSVTAVHRSTGMLLSSSAENKGRNAYIEQLLVRWCLMLGLPI